MAPNRITGLAGATTATSESVEGVYNNAAAPAVREATSLSWFEWDISLGISFPGAYSGTDFNNRGEKGIEKQREENRRLGINRPPTVETTDRFLYLQGGLWAQFGQLGISLATDYVRYDVNAATAESPGLGIALGRVHLVGAYSFLGNQVCIGAGARMLYVDMNTLQDGPASTLNMFGVAPQVGAIVKPDGVSWRIGATARAPVTAGPFSIGNILEEQRPDGETIRRAGPAFIVPDRITQPWEIEAGVAYQLGPRPLNPPWINPRDHERALEDAIKKARAERSAVARAEIEAMPAATPSDRGARAIRVQRILREEEMARAIENAELAQAHERLYAERKARYLNWPREHILLLASVLFTGPSQQAVSLEGFIDQRRELVGRRVSVAPRFAVETEAVPNLIKFRSGIYIEPSRFTDGTVREHFTAGFDVKLFAWNIFGLIPEQMFRLSAFIDLSQRYQNFGFGIGNWH